VVQARQLWRFDDRARRQLTVAQLPDQVNALAYVQPQESFYGIVGSRVVVITPDGHVSDGGAIPQGLRGAHAATAVGPLWLVKSQNEIVALHVPDLTITSHVTLSPAMPVDDWDAYPADGMLYGLTSGEQPQLLRANPATGGVSVVATPQGLPSGGGGSTFPNAVMLGIVGGMLALMVFVIYQVEFPYSRGFAVAPSSLQTAITGLRHVSSG
jgi:hypothetical protein